MRSILTFAFTCAAAVSGVADAQSPTAAPPRAEMTLEQKVDRLTGMVGRQVIVLDEGDQQHIDKYFPGSKSTAQSDNANANMLCREALGDRFGRLISFRKYKAEADMIYFSRVVCETK